MISLCPCHKSLWIHCIFGIHNKAEKFASKRHIHVSVFKLNLTYLLGFKFYLLIYFPQLLHQRRSCFYRMPIYFYTMPRRIQWNPKQLAPKPYVANLHFAIFLLFSWFSEVERMVSPHSSAHRGWSHLKYHTMSIY